MFQGGGEIDKVDRHLTLSCVGDRVQIGYQCNKG